MTMNAYDEMYLDDAMNNLGDMFDYAINDCGYDGDDIYDRFIVSGLADLFGKGNPKYLAGLSGPELASELIYRTSRMRPEVVPSENVEKSPEFWVGWVLAYYQWSTGHRFSDLHRYGLTFDCVLQLYSTLHEADITKFADVADKITAKGMGPKGSRLRALRKQCGVTQRSLAERSGVSLRMIQLYEQGRQDINKAQAISLVRIARVLGCDVLDLLEPTGLYGKALIDDG